MNSEGAKPNRGREQPHTLHGGYITENPNHKIPTSQGGVVHNIPRTPHMQGGKFEKTPMKGLRKALRGCIDTWAASLAGD